MSGVNKGDEVNAGTRDRRPYISAITKRKIDTIPVAGLSNLDAIENEM
jgi:hypothetical protein